MSDDLGVVRSICAEDKTIYILTPVEPSVLERVNCIQYGAVSLPQCLRIIQEVISVTSSCELMSKMQMSVVILAKQCRTSVDWGLVTFLPQYTRTRQHNFFDSWWLVLLCTALYAYFLYDYNRHYCFILLSLPLPGKLCFASVSSCFLSPSSLGDRYKLCRGHWVQLLAGLSTRKPGELYARHYQAFSSLKIS